jgi:hypothetical protein
MLRRETPFLSEWILQKMNKSLFFTKKVAKLLHTRGDKVKSTMAYYSSNTLMVPTPLPEWNLLTM